MLKRLVVKECGIGIVAIIVAIGEDQIALPGRWHLLPELARTLSIARPQRPQMEGQDLQVVTRERQPNPHLLRFGQDKAPHLIENYLIVTGVRGQSLVQRRQLIDFF